MCYRINIDMTTTGRMVMLSLAEQWLTIHKRHTFERMDKRILHRIAFDYEKFFKDKHFWIFVLVIFPLMLYANYAS